MNTPNESAESVFGGATTVLKWSSSVSWTENSFQSAGAEISNSFAALTADVEDDFFDALDSPVLVRASDARAVADLKRIVAGLKEEVRMLVHAGWTVRDIAERFKERARMEADYRARAIGAVRAAWREDPLAAERKMAEHNGWLRAMGIAEISADELRALRPTD